MVEFFAYRRGRTMTGQEETVVRQFQQALSHGIQMDRKEVGWNGFSDRSSKESVADKTDKLSPEIHPITDAALRMPRRNKTMGRETSNRNGATILRRHKTILRRLPP